MTREARTSVTLAGALFFAFVAAFDLLLWRRALQLRPPRLVNTSHQLLQPALVLLLVLIVGAAALAYLIRRSATSRVVAIGLAAAGLALFVWFQRFWLLGVFAFGGGRYWV